VLAGDASSHTQPGSQHPPNRFRSHFDMMVAATDGAKHFSRFPAVASCPQAAVEVR
jgi:hypothetical protein